jgi:hypothetical protein
VSPARLVRRPVIRRLLRRQLVNKEIDPSVFLRALGEMVDNGVPIYAHGPAGSTEIGRIHLDGPKIGALLQWHAYDAQFSDALWQALRTRVSNNQSNEELGAVLEDIVKNTVVPDAYIHLLIGLIGLANTTTDVLLDALRRGTKGLEFCPVCDHPYRRSRGKRRTCNRESCIDAPEKKQHRPVSRAAYMREYRRRQRNRVAEFKAALEDAVGGRSLVSNRNFAAELDRDPEVTRRVDLLAARHPRLKKAAANLRRNSGNRQSLPRIKT